VKARDIEARVLDAIFNLRNLLKLSAVGCVVLFVIYVWPTAWEHYKIRDATFRVNRFTGETQYLSPQGWTASPAH